MTQVVIVVPDAGPLISLAKAKRLDLLIALRLPVYVMDQVYWEATRNKDKPDALAIIGFVEANADLVHIAETETGENARFAREAGRVGKRQSSLGEAAISEFLTGFEARFADTAALLIYEDSDFTRRRIIIPDNVHVVSTKSFIYGLQNRKLIDDAAAIWQSIREAGRQPSDQEVDQPGNVGSDRTQW
ncbi:hypothetical protein [Neorhizobium sp. JUb45]|uniref:hypothetical protein n=1 Tax=unclassified Neorhizobium TaxID=2629175 RepID=UPI00104DC4FA|nr:hypothetical protein [Neorhizobium sp. JUb45]TCR00004.1 hypothetical protein EDF70_10781 [Neorhizobium sp. JUb45]